MIDLQIQDGVHVLRMTAGENRLNRTSLDALNAALDKVEQFDGPTALVTTGEGKFYSNGLDLDWMKTVDKAEANENVHRVHALFARLLASPVITVAALNGHTFAAGAMIALSHDFRVMRSDRGFFCLPEIDIKIPFTPPMQALISARLSKKTAHEVMVTGNRYGGELALQRGIADFVETEADLLPKSIALAKSLAGKDRRTMVAIKRQIYADVLARIDASKSTPFWT